MASTATIGLTGRRTSSLQPAVLVCGLGAGSSYNDSIGADLNTIKTCAIITGVPIIFIMLTIVGWVKWMINDYATSPLKKYVCKVSDTKYNPKHEKG